MQRLADEVTCVARLAAQLFKALVEEDQADVVVDEVDGLVERIHSRPVELLAAARIMLVLAGLDRPQDAVVEPVVMGESDLFGEVVVGTGPEGFGGQHFTTLTGEEDQRGAVFPSAQLDQELETVHPGHLEIAEDAIEELLFQQFQSTFGRIDPADLRELADSLEIVLGQQVVIILIVNMQQAYHIRAL